jgi:RHS repeat-associated protein
MCGYNFTEMLVSLNLVDTPVGYTPPKGPPVPVQLTYNQREAGQPTTFSFFNISPKWTLNWLSYIKDDPTMAGATVSRYVAGGGYVDYTGYNASTGSFTPEVQDASVLALTSSNPVTYRRSLSDGTVEVYSESNGGTGTSRLVFLTQITDPAGNAVKLTYDAQLRLTSVVDATSRATKFTYGLGSSPLLVTKITDPFGRSAQLAYDSSGRLSQITDVLGLTSKFTYDASSLVDSLTTPYGTTTFSYGDNGNSRYLQATDPLGNTERLEYVQGAPGIPLSDPPNTVPPGIVGPFNSYLYGRDTFYWDKHAYAVAAGNYTLARNRHWAHLNTNLEVTSGTIESIKYPLENRIWFNYPGDAENGAGAGQSGTLDEPTNIARVLDDGSQQLTQMQYNGLGNVTGVVDPAGRQTSFQYAANQIDVVAVQQTTASGPATTGQFTYNAQHLPLTYTNAAGKTTKFSYNSAGQVTQITDALGHATKYTYNPFGYLTTIVNANGKTAVSFTYDKYDRVATRTDSEGWTVAFSYDALDRVTQETYPDGTARTFTYKYLDLVSVKDRQGRVTSFAYDAVRDRISQTDPLGQVTQFGYYENGVLKTLSDPNKHTTSWAIDVESRVNAKQYADGSLWGYGYEATTSRLLFVSDPLNQIKQYSYTPDNRLAGIQFYNAVNATPSVGFAYDPYFPRLTAMADGSGTTQYAYQPVGSLGALKLAREQGPFANTAIVYSYDALGRVVGRSVGGNAESFAFDAVGRLVTHADDLGTFARSYLGQTGQITGQGNGTVGTGWTYDTNTNDRRLTGIANGANASQYSFTTTPENDITAIGDTFNKLTWAYSYDAADRLLGASSAAATYSYIDDAAGNLSKIQRPKGTTTIGSNVVNQISKAGASAFVYDSNGNLLHDYARTYQWDADNRLIAIGYLAHPTWQTTFAYDGLGRRIAIGSKSGAASGVTLYLWCGETLCQARSSKNAVTRRYFAEGEESPAENVQLYYGVDQLGSVHDALAAGTNARVAHYDYEPYGTPTNAQQTTTTDFGYAGLFHEQQSGLYLATYRAYDPLMGRWLSRDPIGEVGGTNVYGYARANPMTRIDMYGLESGSFSQRFLCAFKRIDDLDPITQILATALSDDNPAVESVMENGPKIVGATAYALTDHTDDDTDAALFGTFNHTFFSLIGLDYSKIPETVAPPITEDEYRSLNPMTNYHWWPDWRDG